MIKWVDQQTYEELLIVNWEHVQADIDEAKALRETFLPFISDASLRYRIQHDEDTLQNRLQHVEMYFVRDGIDFTISKSNYPRNGICRFDTDLSAFQHIDQYSLQKAKMGLKEPHNFHVPTQRKVYEWIEYLTLVYRNLEKIEAENKVTIETFTNRLKEIPDVIWYKNGNGGQIVRHGITYRFSISSSYFTEQIELNVSCRTLEDFLKLSNNDFEEDRKCAP